MAAGSSTQAASSLPTVRGEAPASEDTIVGNAISAVSQGKQRITMQDFYYEMEKEKERIVRESRESLERAKKHRSEAALATAQTPTSPIGEEGAETASPKAAAKAEAAASLVKQLPPLPPLIAPTMEAKSPPLPKEGKAPPPQPVPQVKSVYKAPPPGLTPTISSTALSEEAVAGAESTVESEPTSGVPSVAGGDPSKSVQIGKREVILYDDTESVAVTELTESDYRKVPDKGLIAIPTNVASTMHAMAKETV